jgi:K+/H+ antiporter YhaU regulatory subunit KhtT
VGVEGVGTVVLALADDTDATFAALVIRELAPDVEVLARASETEKIRKLYRAGADYVLALATVYGRMAAAAIVGEGDSPTDTQVGVARASAPGLAGETLAESAVRERTGVTVIAVERNGEVIAGITPGFVPDAEDTFVVGTEERIARSEALKA